MGGIHPHTEIPTATSLCAQGWHPLMVCHPWHVRNRGNETTSPECHQGADTLAGRGPGSPGHCPRNDSSPGNVTRAGGKETAAPTAHAGQATGDGVIGLVGQGQADPAVFLPPRCHGETQLQQQHRVPTCPLSSLVSNRAMTQLQHLLPTAGSPCHCGLPVPLAVLCERCPAGYYHRKSCNTTANLPAQPCYKSGSGGRAVRQSLPVRAPAPNVLLPHT